MYLLYIYVAVFSIAFIYFIQIICVTHICYNSYVVIAVVLKEFLVDRLLTSLCGIRANIRLDFRGRGRGRFYGNRDA